MDCLPYKETMDVAWDLWSHQNGILHHSENMLAVAEQRELDQRIKTTYINLARANVVQLDRYLF
jgi:hypothetical protein